MTNEEALALKEADEVVWDFPSPPSGEKEFAESYERGKNLAVTKKEELEKPK